MFKLKTFHDFSGCSTIRELLLLSLFSQTHTLGSSKYSIYDATVDDWSIILKLSYDWRFPEVKKLCCRELEKFTIAPLQKIELYQTYELDRKLLIPSYIAMCRRPEPLTIKEGRQLGLETALLLATARETSRGTPTNGVLSPSAVSVEDGDMSSIIKDIFGITDGPPSPSLTPTDHNAMKPALVGLTSPRRPSLGTTTTAAAAQSAVKDVFGTVASPAVAPSNASSTTAVNERPAQETAKSPGQYSPILSPLKPNSRLISVFQTQGSAPEPQEPQSHLAEVTPLTAPVLKLPKPKAQAQTRSETPPPPTPSQERQAETVSREPDPPQVRRKMETARERKAREKAEKEMIRKEKARLDQELLSTTRRTPKTAATPGAGTGEVGDDMDNSTSTGANTPVVSQSDAADLVDVSLTAPQVGQPTTGQPSASGAPSAGDSSAGAANNETKGAEVEAGAVGADAVTTTSTSAGQPTEENTEPKNAGAGGKPELTVVVPGTASASLTGAIGGENSDGNDLDKSTSRTGENAADEQAETTDPRADANGSTIPGPGSTSDSMPEGGSQATSGGGGAAADEAKHDGQESENKAPENKPESPSTDNVPAAGKPTEPTSQQTDDVAASEHRSTGSTDSTESWHDVSRGLKTETASQDAAAAGDPAVVGGSSEATDTTEPSNTGAPFVKVDADDTDPAIPAWDFGDGEENDAERASTSVSSDTSAA